MSSFFKKIILLSVSLISVSSIATASDFTAGVTAWYTNWSVEDEDGSSGADVDPSILYGPALLLRLNEIYSITFVFLYGSFRFHDSESETIYRYDSDLAINYRLSEYFKIFAGAKYMRFEARGKFYNHSLGPALGLGVTIPVLDNLFIIGNASGLYSWGEEVNQDSSTDNTGVRFYGMNSSLMLSWYIPAASASLSIGGRYQPVVMIQEDRPSSEDETKFQFYGLTATAVYSF